MWSDSEYILKVEPRGFADRLGGEWLRIKSKSKTTLRSMAQTTRRWNCHFIKRERLEGDCGAVVWGGWEGDQKFNFRHINERCQLDIQANN